MPKKSRNIFSIKIAPRSAFDTAIQQGNIAKAKKIIDSRNGFDRRDFTVLASTLLMQGRKEEAKIFIDQLEEDFKQQLDSQPEEKKANWIVNFVLSSGWSMRSITINQLPLEKIVLKSFKPVSDSPKINETLARSVDSFTPPTPASRKLLVKMMKTLPQSKQITTTFEVNQLADRIRDSPKTDHAKLRQEALRMIKGPVKGQKNDFACRLSFAFAVAGDEEGIDQMINLISTAGFKSWALFQCAKVFPPRRESNPRYNRSGQLGGGLF